MKGKKIILKIVIGIPLLGILLLTTACSNSTGTSKAGKNEYGFKSAFSDNYSEDYKLEKFPLIKEKMLEMESKILDTGLKIRLINFSYYGIRGIYYLGDDSNGYDEIKLEFDQKRSDEIDAPTDEYELHSIEMRIFDDSMYEQAKNAIIKFAGLTDDEALLMNDIETKYKEDGIYTMTYYIDYTEGEEKSKSNVGSIQIEESEDTNNSNTLSYKKIVISNYETENERKTTLYSYKREQNRPKADGESFDNLGLSLYIPNGFTANPYNGMLYTWDYYTGDYGNNSMPNGVDVNIKINGLKEGVTFDEYVRNDSRPAKSKGVTPFETKEINGHTWYTCNNGKVYYYGAEFAENTYEIEIKDGDVINGVTLQATLDMIEKTLFFE